MNQKNMPDLSMTKVEELLKQCLGSRRDKIDSILSSEELTEYILWMLTDFAPRHHISLSISDLPDFLMHSSHSTFAEQLLDSPEDKRIQNALSVTYGQQNEQQYIFESYDISVNRMLRFMPPQWHQSNFFKVYYTLSGVCPLHIADEVIEISSRTVVIVAPDVLCATPCYFEDCVLLTFMLRQSTFDKVFWNQLSSDNLLSGFFRQALAHKNSAAYLHFETDADSELYDLLCRIYIEYYHPQAYGPQLLNALMSEFFTLLLRRYEGSVRLPRTKNFFWKHEFSAILNYIQQNYATATINEVAEKFHYSRRQIGRIVKNYTGQSYAELTHKLRMEKAGRLLCLGTLRPEEIAAATGYSTLSSFYRAFTHHYGCTPGEYKSDSALSHVHPSSILK